MLRAFQTTFLVAIDDDDEDLDLPITKQDVIDYLNDALIVDVNMEEYGNPVGFQSAEVKIASLVELSGDEVKKLYGRQV